MNTTLSPKDHISLLTMPIELRIFALKNCVSSSPYNRGHSGSFYNNTTKTWDHTEDGTIRISDHWNFWSRGVKHCITDIESDKIEGKWVVAEFRAETGLYHVITADEKIYSEISKREHRYQVKKITDPLLVNRERRERKLAEIRFKRRMEARSKKITKKSLWVTFETNIWSKGSRGRWNHFGTRKHVGQLVHETRCTVTVIENGHYNTYKNVISYKELDRKPYTKKAPK